jgi:hypothetical protein
VGREKGRRPRVFVQDLDGGAQRAVTPEGVRRPVLLGDGRLLCARSPEGEWLLYPSDGNGQPRRVAGILPGEEPIGSTPDGLHVRGADELRPGDSPSRRASTASIPRPAAGSSEGDSGRPADRRRHPEHSLRPTARPRLDAHALLDRVVLAEGSIGRAPVERPGTAMRDRAVRAERSRARCCSDRRR